MLVIVKDFAYRRERNERSPEWEFRAIEPKQNRY